MRCKHESDKITNSMGYCGAADWHEWMSYTHKQTLCDKCNKWAIWKWKGIKRKRPSWKYEFTEKYERDLS